MISQRVSLEQQISAERARTLFGNTAPGLPINGALAGVLVVLTAPTAGLPRALVWYATVLLASLLHWAVGRAWHSANPGPAEAERWIRRFVVTSGVNGAAWGWGAIALFVPGAVLEQITVTATVVCLAAGLTASTLASTPAILSFTLTLLPPYIVALGAGGTRIHLALATMLIAFLCAVVFVRSNNRVFAELITLRHSIGFERDRAEQANLAKSKFLAAASHDLRQPLHAMTLLAGALCGRLKDPRDEQTLVSLSDSLEAMRKLFNALLDISRLDAGIVEPRNQNVRLGSILERLDAELQLTARAKRLEWRCPPTPLVVRTDPVLLETMLRNLLGNAVRYTERGHVAISCETSNGDARISIEDTGPGIPAEQQPKVFREFYQLHNPERDSEKGLGLGLAIVDRLARLLGHRVELCSAPGEGSRFSVVMPLAPEGAAAEEGRPKEHESAPTSELSGLKVLVIDDQQAGRESMRALLQHWGCEVRLADSEDSALEAVRAGRYLPELLIADYRLREGRTGAMAIARLRAELGRELPALVVTGDTSPERLREARSSGAELMHKPVPLGRLAAYLRSVRRIQAAGAATAL
ncbi:MAG TPA: ATP-binding protein [Polyangiaceae bacterium]|nr:ATP-binding protein [Polyangiaceae bacterium]